MFNYKNLNDNTQLRVFIGYNAGFGGQAAMLDILEALNARGVTAKITIIYIEYTALKLKEILKLSELNVNKLIEIENKDISPHKITLMSMEYFLKHRKEMPIVPYGITGNAYGRKGNIVGHLLKCENFVSFSPYIPNAKAPDTTYATQITTLGSQLQTYIPNIVRQYHLHLPTTQSMEYFYNTEYGRSVKKDKPLIPFLLDTKQKEYYILPVYGLDTDFLLNPAEILGRLAESITRFKKKFPDRLPGKIVIVLLNRFSKKDLNEISEMLSASSSHSQEAKFTLPACRLVTPEQLDKPELVTDIPNDSLVIVNTGFVSRTEFNRFLAITTLPNDKKLLPRIPVIEGANSRKLILGNKGCGHHINIYESDSEVWPYVLERVEKYDSLSNYFKRLTISLHKIPNSFINSGLVDRNDVSNNILKREEGIKILYQYFIDMSNSKSIIRKAWKKLILDPYQATKGDRIDHAFDHLPLKNKSYEKSLEDYNLLKSAVKKVLNKKHLDNSEQKQIKKLMKRYSPFDTPNTYDYQPVFITLARHSHLQLLGMAIDMYPKPITQIAENDINKIYKDIDINSKISEIPTLHKSMEKRVKGYIPELIKYYKAAREVLDNKNLSQKKIDEIKQETPLILSFMLQQAYSPKQVTTVCIRLYYAKSVLYTAYAKVKYTRLEELIKKLSLKDKTEALYSIAYLSPEQAILFDIDSVYYGSDILPKKTLNQSLKDALKIALEEQNEKMALWLLDSKNAKALSNLRLSSEHFKFAVYNRQYDCSSPPVNRSTFC